MPPQHRGRCGKRGTEKRTQISFPDPQFQQWLTDDRVRQVQAPVLPLLPRPGPLHAWSGPTLGPQRSIRSSRFSVRSMRRVSPGRYRGRCRRGHRACRRCARAVFTIIHCQIIQPDSLFLSTVCGNRVVGTEPSLWSRCRNNGRRPRLSRSPFRGPGRQAGGGSGCRAFRRCCGGGS